MEYHRYVKILLASGDNIPELSPEIKKTYGFSELVKIAPGEKIPKPTIFSGDKLFVCNGTLNQILQSLTLVETIDKTRVLVLLCDDYIHKDITPCECGSLQIHGIKQDASLVMTLQSPLVISASYFTISNITIQLESKTTEDTFHISSLYTCGGLILTKEMKGVKVSKCIFNGNGNSRVNILDIIKSADQVDINWCIWTDTALYLEKCQSISFEYNKFTNIHMFIRFSQGNMYLNTFHNRVRLDIFNCGNFLLTHNTFKDITSYHTVINADHHSKVFVISNQFTTQESQETPITTQVTTPITTQMTTPTTLVNSVTIPVTLEIPETPVPPVSLETPVPPVTPIPTQNDQSYSIFTVDRFSKCIVSRCHFVLSPVQLFAQITFNSKIDMGFCSFNQPTVEVAYDDDDSDMNTLCDSNKSESSMYVSSSSDDKNTVPKPIEIKFSHRGIIPYASKGVILT